jgi:hypothetical protein
VSIAVLCALEHGTLAALPFDQAIIQQITRRRWECLLCGLSQHSSTSNPTVHMQDTNLAMPLPCCSTRPATSVRSGDELLLFWTLASCSAAPVAVGWCWEEVVEEVGNPLPRRRGAVCCARGSLLILWLWAVLGPEKDEVHRLCCICWGCCNMVAHPLSSTTEQ